MKQLYHVLILEDNPSDEELITNELKKNGFPFTFTRVETRDDFVRELAERRPELILSDYTLPSFDGMAALSIARERFREIPFIFVTGTLGEENAIEALKNGATDYVLKDRLSKLSPAVIRALQDVEEKSARAKAETAQRESERRYRLMIESAGLGIGYYDLEGMLIYFNKISLSYMNGSLGDFVGQSVHDMYDKDLADQIMDRMKEAAASEEVKTYEDCVTIPAGMQWFRSHYSRVLDVDGTVVGVQIVSENVTERKQGEENLKKYASLLRIAGDKAKLGGWSVDLETNLCTWSDETAAIHERPAGYAPLVEEGISYYAPEWREKITKVFTECAQNGIPYDEEMEIITASGKRVWVRTMGEPVKDEAGKIIRVQGAFQDITERKRAEEELQRQLKELKRWHAVTVDREGRLLELKKEVNDLLKEAGRPDKYGGS